MSYKSRSAHANNTHSLPTSTHISVICRRSTERAPVHRVQACLPTKSRCADIGPIDRRCTIQKAPAVTVATRSGNKQAHRTQAITDHAGFDAAHQRSKLVCTKTTTPRNATSKMCISCINRPDTRRNRQNYVTESLTSSGWLTVAVEASTRTRQTNPSEAARVRCA